MMNLYLSPEQLDKFAERQVDIVNQYHELPLFSQATTLRYRPGEGYDLAGRVGRENQGSR
jgi:hypothetical protein